MNAHLLLDTCALIYLSGYEGEAELVAIEKALNEAAEAGQNLFLCPITAWEIGLLAAKGRLSLAQPANTWLSRLMRTAQAKWTDLTPEILLSSNELPGQVHADPADRIIIATARDLGLRLLTRDRRILDYADKGHVMALAC